jgi:hypothetical protein
MARLDKHAHTLTGALGVPLQRIVIAQAGVGKDRFAPAAKSKTLAIAPPQVNAALSFPLISLNTIIAGER